MDKKEFKKYVEKTLYEAYKKYIVRLNSLKIKVQEVTNENNKRINIANIDNLDFGNGHNFNTLYIDLELI